MPGSYLFNKGAPSTERVEDRLDRHPRTMYRRTRTPPYRTSKQAVEALCVLRGSGPKACLSQESLRPSVLGVEKRRHSALCGQRPIYVRCGPVRLQRAYRIWTAAPSEQRGGYLCGSLKMCDQHAGKWSRGVKIRVTSTANAKIDRHSRVQACLSRVLSYHGLYSPMRCRLEDATSRRCTFGVPFASHVVP
ncbi:hypothetical protein DAEQUDRAFT_726810 [Daedalea quercina L-15889]|uniref:Uncharacterized protein n=1 Tax=Daedalea quercina L-15889 TaxID=1314783 RepID=A0A165QAW3_9APHY|nr:hypothetical protein DAEQUDRAFT_726810 [Daedalea quercina L-15889]